MAVTVQHIIRVLCVMREEARASAFEVTSYAETLGLEEWGRSKMADDTKPPTLKESPCLQGCGAARVRAG